MFSFDGFPVSMKIEIVEKPVLSARQWKSGIAAWLGWFFDGLDMHLYTLVAAPFVAELIHVTNKSDPLVKQYSSWIQASFLVGWALGGGIFGWIGDRMGRSRALSLTILTYAMFTGLSFLAHTWWQLLIFRFVAALGIGGEWAVGASLLSETWPKTWRPWIAAVLQTGVNVGILFACWFIYAFPDLPPRYVFLIGVLPAFIVFWIRHNVPEPEEWAAASKAATVKPGVRDLFKGEIRGTTILTMIVCSLTLTGWWAFMFWHPQHLQSLPEVAKWSEAEKRQLVSKAFSWVVGISIGGNYFASWMAKIFGYRRAIFWGCVAFVAAFAATFGVQRGPDSLLIWLPVIGFCSGIFGLFTMYLPPLFPTLLRTTGAGFCYNIGRIVAAIGTIVFALYLKHVDFRNALLCIGVLFALAAVFALFLPDLKEGE